MCTCSTMRSLAASPSLVLITTLLQDIQRTQQCLQCQGGPSIGTTSQLPSRVLQRRVSHNIPQCSIRPCVKQKTTQLQVPTSCCVVQWCQATVGREHMSELTPITKPCGESHPRHECTHAIARCHGLHVDVTSTIGKQGMHDLRVCLITDDSIVQRQAPEDIRDSSVSTGGDQRIHRGQRWP